MDVPAGISYPRVIQARYPEPQPGRSPVLGLISYTPKGHIPIPTIPSESRYLTFGATFAGRCLVVSYTERGDTIRVISARAMTPRERKAYED